VGLAVPRAIFFVFSNMPFFQAAHKTEIFNCKNQDKVRSAVLHSNIFSTEQYFFWQTAGVVA
jgi:hypothetical protein